MNYNFKYQNAIFQNEIKYMEIFKDNILKIKLNTDKLINRVSFIVQ